MMKKTFVAIALIASCSFSTASLAQMPAGEDPCPIPNVAISQTPDDLAKVQADIDRFTLCVERAQLLSRLNDLALENQQAILGASVNSPGLNLEEDIPDFDRSRVQPSPSPIPTFPTAPQAKEKPDTQEWIVVNIFGAGQNLQAKLEGPDDAFAQVRVGDRLPDGATVESITASGVMIRNKDGEQQALTWRE